MAYLFELVAAGKICVDSDVLNEYEIWFCRIDDESGYKRVRVWQSGNRAKMLSRLIMKAPPDIEVDHRDRDGTNCVRSNLRFATSQQNAANRARKIKSKTGYRGVYVHGSLFQASVRVNHKLQSLGSFVTAEEAARVYDKAAKIAFGEFAVLNFPS